MFKTPRKKYKKRKKVNKFTKPIFLQKKNGPPSWNFHLVDYKNLAFLRQFISFQGKILPRRLTGLGAKYQRKVSTAIKTARVAGLFPFITQ